MPAIVESAKGTLGKRVGPLPVGGWAAIAIGGFVVVRLLGRGKSGGSSSGGTSGGFTLPDAGGAATGDGGSAGGVGSSGDGGASGAAWSGSHTITLPGGGTITIPGSIPIIGGTIPLPPIPGLEPPAGGGTTITPPPTPVPNPVNVPSKLRLTITGGTDLFSTVGKLIGHGTSGTYDATIVKLGNQSYYRILRRNAAGKMQWTLIPKTAKTVTVTHV